jgi:hypothetical protein
MKTYRVYFKKNGIKLTKLVYADSLLDAIKMFEGIEIIDIKEIDKVQEED